MVPAGLRAPTTAARSTTRTPRRRSGPPPPNLPRPPTASRPLPHHDTAPDGRAHLLVNSHADMLDLVEDPVEPSGPTVTGSGAPHLNAAWSWSDVISPRPGRRRGGRRRTTLAPLTNE